MSFDPAPALQSQTRAAGSELTLALTRLARCADAISIIKAGSEGKTSPLDDRNMLLEKVRRRGQTFQLRRPRPDPLARSSQVVTLLSSLPPDSPVGTSLQNVFSE